MSSNNDCHFLYNDFTLSSWGRSRARNNSMRPTHTSPPHNQDRTNLKSLKQRTYRNNTDDADFMTTDIQQQTTEDTDNTSLEHMGLWALQSHPLPQNWRKKELITAAIL